MVALGEALSAHCVHLRKMPGWIVTVQKIFCKPTVILVVVNNKDNRVFLSQTIGLIVVPWKFDVLKTRIFALEALLLGQMFVLRTPNFGGATISR